MLALLTLFSFGADEKYEVKINSCKDNEIVFVYKGKEYTGNLFNIEMNNEGWEYACNDIVNANKVEIEIDDIIIVNKIEAYFFVDNVLLNTKLIEEKKASLIVKNPNYKYYKDINEIKEAMAPISKESTGGLPRGFYAIGFLIICICLELFLSRRLKVHS